MIHHAMGTIANCTNMESFPTSAISDLLLALLERIIEANWISIRGTGRSPGITNLLRDSLFTFELALTLSLGAVRPETIHSLAGPLAI